ncbi:MAG: hypothetical protein II956_08910 [Bacteroidales bacterium]|nr:hypothetical protein [Bacteroidales bacterium]
MRKFNITGTCYTEDIIFETRFKNYFDSEKEFQRFCFNENKVSASKTLKLGEKEFVEVVV